MMTQTTGLLNVLGTPDDMQFFPCWDMSFGTKQIWVQIPALTLDPRVALVQLHPFFGFLFHENRMAGTSTSRAYSGSEQRVITGRTWQRQRRGERSEKSLIREQTIKSHALHTNIANSLRGGGLCFLAWLASVVLPRRGPSFSADPPGSPDPARSGIINLGEARGQCSEDSRRAPSGVPRWLVTYVSEEEGLSWWGVCSLQKTSALRAVKDPGGTVLKAKK